MKRNIILDRSLDFALAVIQYAETLEKSKKYVIARQVLKSGTSIGANLREAQNVHGKKDFIAKCMIALKESDETEYWLYLCQKSQTYPDPGLLIDKISEIKKILTSIVATSIRSSKSLNHGIIKSWNH